MLNEQRIIKTSSKKDGEGGKSGQMFFQTHDKRLILKTTNDEEAKLFINMLEDYSQHFRQNPSSQIARIFGLFELKFSDVGGRNIKIFVMEAIGPPEQTAILRKYDLKGSAYDRQVERAYKSIDLDCKIEKILKDTDFQNIEVSFDIEISTKKQILNSITKDVQFFGKHNIIDYSLIVIVADKT